MPKVLKRDESVEQIPYIGVDRDNDGYIDTIEGIQYGKTSNGLYVPVRVDANGRQEVIPTNAAGELGTLVNPVNIRSTGRRLMEQSAISREVRQGGTYNARLQTPEGAVGCIVYLAVYGITGTFDATQGISLSVYFATRNGLGTLDAYGLAGATNKYAQKRNHSVIINNGASKGDLAGYPDNTLCRVAGVPLGSQAIFIAVGITGTFAAGEGIDCEVVIQWLY